MDIHGVSQVNDWLTDGQTDWLNEWINQLINRSIDQLINQLINEILTIAETVAQSRCVSGHTVATQWCSDRWAVGARDTVGRTLCHNGTTTRDVCGTTLHITSLYTVNPENKLLTRGICQALGWHFSLFIACLQLLSSPASFTDYRTLFTTNLAGIEDCDWSSPGHVTPSDFLILMFCRITRNTLSYTCLQFTTVIEWEKQYGVMTVPTQLPSALLYACVLLHPFGLHHGLPLCKLHARQFFGQSWTRTNTAPQPL